MIDLDHFKSFNDTYGHSVGDEVLKATAQAVATVVRGKGEAYRYGGEEISVILPNHALVEAAAVAERIRNEIERVRINSNPDVSATASIGVASIWVTPRWQSQRHRMLVDLENTGQQVYYAAPIFHLQTAFNAEFQGNTVVNRSVFISPAEIKMVVASAKDRSTRKPLFPVAWDNEVLLVPAVRKQRKPVFTSDEVSKIVERASGQCKVMFVVLAASGLRISELLGLQIENVLDDCYRLRIVENNYNGKQEDRLKTLSAERIVELHSTVAVLLRSHIV